MHRKRILSFVGMVLLLAGGVWYVVVVTPRSTPWEETGTVVLVAHAMPEPAQQASAVLGLGLGDVALVESGGNTIRLALTSQRILLDVQDTRLYEVLRTDVHTGSYNGVRFSIKSPEMRNDWRESTPPEPVTMVGDEMYLEAPFTVETGATTVILLGFETLRAIHSQEGRATYLPVIHTEVRTSATVEAADGSTVSVRDGTIVFNMLFGMDWDGTVHKNFRARVPIPAQEESIPVVEQEIEIAPEEVLEETASTSDNADRSVSTSTATSADADRLLEEI